MAKYTGAVCRLCRREGKKLFLKGDRCYSDRCSLLIKKNVPGEHGQLRKKFSSYCSQLREKQMAKRYYGVLERQFSRYFELAERKKGLTGENLLRILESRLDNVIYMAGFAASRAEAKQLILHRHFKLNGKRVNIPSILVKEKDLIQVNEKSKKSLKFKNIFEKLESHTSAPLWMEVRKAEREIFIIRLCNRDEVGVEVAEHLIVELYSK